MAAADFGVGNMNNQELRKKWQGSNSQKLAVYQYVKASFYLKWDEANKKFILNRTASLNQLFFDLKNGKMLFPQSYANIKEHDVFNHIMAEYEEIIDSTSGKTKVYRHAASKPDDFLHSLNFAHITGRRLTHQPLIDYAGCDDISPEILYK